MASPPLASGPPYPEQHEGGLGYGRVAGPGRAPFHGKRRVADARPGQEDINAENTPSIFYWFNERLDPWGNRRPFQGIP